MRLRSASQNHPAFGAQEWFTRERYLKMAHGTSHPPSSSSTHGIAFERKMASRPRLFGPPFASSMSSNSRFCCGRPRVCSRISRASAPRRALKSGFSANMMSVALHDAVANTPLPSPWIAPSLTTVCAGGSCGSRGFAGLESVLSWNRSTDLVVLERAMDVCGRCVSLGLDGLQLVHTRQHKTNLVVFDRVCSFGFFRGGGGDGVAGTSTVDGSMVGTRSALSGLTLRLEAGG